MCIPSPSKPIAKRPKTIYNTLADNPSATSLDATQVFSIDAIDSVEVLGVVASFDDDSEDSE